MQWRRREFLGLIVGATGGLFVERIPWPSVVDPRRSAPSLLLVGLRATAASDVDGYRALRIARPSGQILLGGAIGPGQTFHWFPQLGNEIVWADGLVNLSDVDVDVQLSLTDGHQHWCIGNNETDWFPIRG